MQTITPEEAARLLRDGATLIDIREPDEHARARIPGARNLPLSRLHGGELAVAADRPVLFHCRSGARTGANAAALAEKAGGCEAYVVSGGLDAWRAAGLPVTENRRAPIEIMRQVQMIAGSLVLAGVLLGTFVAPGFYALSGLVGAGLVFAGASGNCMMATVLRRAPWNRAATA